MKQQDYLKKNLFYLEKYSSKLISYHQNINMVSDNIYKKEMKVVFVHFILYILLSKNILKVRKDFRAVQRKCAHVDISFVLEQ